MKVFDLGKIVVILGEKMKLESIVRFVGIVVVVYLNVVWESFCIFLFLGFWLIIVRERICIF